jgi:ribosomal protein S18 acetylase RimI-like enzyme
LRRGCGSILDMEHNIVRINKDNYHMFDDMIFYRKNERYKNENELKEKQNFNSYYQDLESTNLYVFAVQSEEKFVGYISIVYLPKIGRGNGRGYLYVDELWVNPNFRRKGIANALMKKADILSKKMNTLGLRLYVSADNPEGISLYEKCGYENNYGPSLFMEKEW